MTALELRKPGKLFMFGVLLTQGKYKVNWYHEGCCQHLLMYLIVSMFLNEHVALDWTRWLLKSV